MHKGKQHREHQDTRLDNTEIMPHEMLTQDILRTNDKGPLYSARCCAVHKLSLGA